MVSLIMYDDEYAICTLTDTKAEIKNVKVSDIFYFLNESTIKLITTKKGNDIYFFYKAIREFLECL